MSSTKRKYEGEASTSRRHHGEGASHTDGVWAFKYHSRKEFWPIWARNALLAGSAPVLIGLACHVGHPLLDCISLVLEQLQELICDGLAEVSCFIADLPAWSWVKCTPGHTAFEACEYTVMPKASPVGTGWKQQCLLTMAT